MAGHNQTDDLRLREQLGIPVYSARRLLLISDSANWQGFTTLWPKSSSAPQQLLVIRGLPCLLRTTRQTVRSRGGGAGAGPLGAPVSSPGQQLLRTERVSAYWESLVSFQDRGTAVLIVSGHRSFWGEAAAAPSPEKPLAPGSTSLPARRRPSGPPVPALWFPPALLGPAGWLQAQGSVLLLAPGEEARQMLFPRPLPARRCCYLQEPNAQDPSAELHPEKGCGVAQFSLTRPFFRVKVWIHISLCRVCWVCSPGCV